MPRLVPFLSLFSALWIWRLTSFNFVNFLLSVFSNVFFWNFYYLNIILPGLIFQLPFLFYFFMILFIYFLERGKEGKRERNINVWLPLTRPLLGTWPTTQACALTGNWTGNSLIRGPVLNQWATPARAQFYYLISHIYFFIAFFFGFFLFFSSTFWDIYNFNFLISILIF